MKVQTIHKKTKKILKKCFDPSAQTVFLLIQMKLSEQKKKYFFPENQQVLDQQFSVINFCSLMSILTFTLGLVNTAKFSLILPP